MFSFIKIIRKLLQLISVNLQTIHSYIDKLFIDTVYMYNLFNLKFVAQNKTVRQE